MSTFIRPICDEQGQPLTNLEMCKRILKEMDHYKNPPLTMSKPNREKLMVTYSTLCGDQDKTDKMYEWLQSIVNTEDEFQAQRLIDSTLIPVQFH